MGAIINKNNIIQKQIPPTYILTSYKGVTFISVNFAASSWSNPTSNLCSLFTKATNLPIFWNHPHLSLLVPLIHFHSNPILFKCAPTFASNTATRSVSSGIGAA